MKRVLLIEDDQDQIKMYQYIFERDGFEFFASRSVEEGILAVKEKKPDLVLLDLLLKEVTKLNGLEVLKKLKSDEETKDIPVVVLTNFGTTKAKQDSLALGAIDFIIKTQVDPPDLVKRVRKALG